MLIWTDLETTGLDSRKDSILEVAAIATDDQFNEVARFHRVVYSPLARRVLDNEPGLYIDPFVIEMHKKNGLWAESIHGEALPMVDYDFALFIKSTHYEESYLDEKTQTMKTRIVEPQLAGSTISFDRGFILASLPYSERELHYRNLDVSTLNEFTKRFFPAVWESRPKLLPGQEKAHRGMADILESITVAKYYTKALCSNQP